MMTDDELVAVLGRRIDAAMNDEDGDLSDIRQDAFDYYVGKPYGNERDGFSKVRTREVLEAVEWALPSILRVFTGSERIVSFDPEGPEDESLAEQETDVVNHVLLKKNEGFVALHHWFKDALLYPNGYVKCAPEERTWTVRTEYEGLTPLEAEALLQDPEVNILTSSDNEDGTFDVKVERTRSETLVKVYPCPGEEVLVGRDLTSCNMDEAGFVAHRRRRTLSELVEEGYDRDDLEEAGTGDSGQWNDERVNRLYLEDENPDEQDDGDEKTFWVHECYAKVDYDGDGLAERRKVLLIGGTVFENEEIDYQPFVSLSSILMPHKHSGMSLASTVTDLQLIKSTLTRQLLDNIYRINVRRKYVSEDYMTDETMDFMLNAMSEIVPVRGDARAAVAPEAAQPIVQDILPVIQYLDDEGQTRTGVAPNLSLDPNVLQQSTMGSFTAALEQASQRIEMIVRIFAETGVKHLMQKIHELTRRYADGHIQMKLSETWVTVDPSTWRERKGLTVNVGLGFSNKAQKVQLLTGLLDLQKEALGMGGATWGHLYNTLEKLVEQADIGSVARYFVSPEQYQPPEQQPDAQMALVQAQIQTEQAKAQNASQAEQAKHQREMAKLQYEAQMAIARENREAAKLQMERERLMLERVKIEADVGLTRAQTAKTAEEARGLDLDNDAAESGVTEALEGMMRLEEMGGAQGSEDAA